MKFTRPALARVLADQVAFTGTTLPDGKVVDIAPDLDNLAGEFVACNQPDGDGPLRPLIPIPDMDIGATDTGLMDLDQHVVRSDFGYRSGLHPKTFLCFGLHQRFHRVHDNTPVSRPAFAKASSAKSSSSFVSAAFIWVRIRA